jgi:uncharacterized protein YfaS (alpha-2-macroglobulin family)
MIEELLDATKATEPHGEVWFGSGERELAVRLLAWSQFKPKSREVDTLVEELMRTRRNGRWNNTQGNAWAVLAVTKYAGAVERGEKNIAGELRYASSTEKFQLTPKTHVFETGHAIAPAAPDTSPGPLVLANPQKGTLFTQVKMEARPKTAKQPRQDRGYLIQRSYAKVQDDGALAGVNDLRVGDRVLVTLRIEVRQPAHYVAIDDPLPSVLEAVNPDFKSQATRAGDATGRDWASDYRELRIDRALFFRDHLPPGNYSVQYLARVRAAGEVTAPAAKIEEMYRPERYGLTATTDLRARAGVGNDE